MKTASISEAKNQLSALIDQVRHGDVVIITDRGRPVAQLASLAGEPGDAVTGRVDRLEREGVLRRGAGGGPVADILRPPPRPKRGVSIVQAVLDERYEGR
ncbi:MAG: prevent-host-death family protein [Acidobacteria bacterium]|jgi:prevent-host-death family protein|nr:prevent-host-death family protein [Acidobacteriota bacterium]MDP7338304.1 type II toxin-antitoxin system prevent-host-death family antitoxin [Vicinamibacterales bacterium]MDP7481060.1 type II toxin-antitoxin system prevent-host-death family antitoxin [Vicinamibacterales bacterium]HJN45729.1 type II toxin-antitoxin system prevent-host-death family antitoxin [Vicinamibacterales bacterium]|tara:strand:+ start:26 stop:325 length:300 start_codon:yes stop_codon:yes gene_type:complete